MFDYFIQLYLIIDEIVFAVYIYYVSRSSKNNCPTYVQ